MNRNPLNRIQMIEAIEHGAYLPQTIGSWIYPSVFEGKCDEIQALLDKYPIDVQFLVPTFPGYAESPFADHPSYVWGGRFQAVSAAIDSKQLIADWNELDSFIENMPKASFGPITEAAVKMASEDDFGRYKLCHFWYFFYERLWSFRGMENALIDLYTNQNEVMRLFEALSDFYIGVIDRVFNEIGCDGVYVTDDLGTQRNLMFSPGIFRKIFVPFYRKVVDFCHKKEIHFWLHSCGNIESIIPDLIEIGVDVIHPIQKFAMDEVSIKKKFKDKICFMCGMDVQQVMPFGRPEDVRAEVNRLVDIYKEYGGRMIFSLGNGATNNIPFENLYTLYDEIYNLRERYYF